MKHLGTASITHVFESMVDLIFIPTLLSIFLCKTMSSSKFSLISDIHNSVFNLIDK
jgi:hypothetical protein